MILYIFGPYVFYITEKNVTTATVFTIHMHVNYADGAVWRSFANDARKSEDNVPSLYMFVILWNFISAIDRIMVTSIPKMYVKVRQLLSLNLITIAVFNLKLLETFT